MPISLSLSLSLCASCFLSHAGSSPSQNVALAFALTALFTNIWYQSIGGSSTRCQPPLQHNILFFASFEETEKKEGKHKLESHRVRSPFRVSQPPVPYSCDCNRLTWASCATTTRSCFIRLNGIWTGHWTLFATRCNHSREIGLQTTTAIRSSFGWSTFGRISWIRLSRRCSHPKQNKS